MVLDRLHGGHWGIIAAFIGCLIFPAAPLIAQSPNPAGAAGEGPAVHGQRGGDTGRSQEASKDFAFPVRIIEDPAEAQDAKEREERSEGHDADDLKAQQDAARAAVRSADAAEGQYWPTMAQVGLATVGTFLVFFALIYSARGTRIALKAYQADNRPWIAVSIGRTTEVSCIEGSGCVLSFRISLRNIGKAPASEVIIQGKILDMSDQNDIVAG